jgi:hypothetical protein
MIIVTGTKRSGTSMWMQLLTAAGFPPIGEAFPRSWDKTIKNANPGGFWESTLRRGIYHETNPDPATGAYLFPQATERHVVKVFIPGLIRSDRAFIGKVIATIRPWRQYVRSVTRLYDMEQEARNELTNGAAPAPVVMEPVIEWWVENFSLISDIVTRRYPFYMVAYDSVLTEPKKTLQDLFRWLGEGDVERAVAEVAPELRTQHQGNRVEYESDSCDLGQDVIDTFDALYALVRDRSPLDQTFVDRLNETNRTLGERIEEAVKALASAQLEQLKTRRSSGSSASVLAPTGSR